MGDGQVGAVRSPIVQSWRRSRAAGVDPSPAHRAPLVADEEGTSARWEQHPLAGAAGLISDCLGAIAQDSGQLIVVSDADGLLLWIDGPPRVRLDAADSMNFIQGAMWSEAGAGTNAIGTAIAADHAVQVFAAEHFNEVVQEWTCAAAPVHDPDTGRLLGVIDLTGRRKTVRSHNMAVAVAAARSVELYLRTLMHEGDGRLRSRYGDLLSERGPRLLVAPSGRVVASTARGWREGQRWPSPRVVASCAFRTGRLLSRSLSAARRRSLCAPSTGSVPPADNRRRSSCGRGCSRPPTMRAVASCEICTMGPSNAW